MALSETGALVALSNDVAATVERVAPGVVAVEARSRIGSSGFFIRHDLILTADHALESDEIEIVRADGKTENATVAGRDPSTDLALLRVEKAGTPLEFASVDALRVGAIVLAVARDDDGDLAASMGVISALGAPWRTWHGGDIDRFVRPDLSLYPRFSGSPLVDVTGRVIGLNTGGLSPRQSLTVPAAATAGRPAPARLSRRRAASRARRCDRPGRRGRQPGRQGRLDRRRHHHRDRRRERRGRRRRARAARREHRRYGARDRRAARRNAETSRRHRRRAPGARLAWPFDTLRAAEGLKPISKRSPSGCARAPSRCGSGATARARA